MTSTSLQNKQIIMQLREQTLVYLFKHRFSNKLLISLVKYLITKNEITHSGNGLGVENFVQLKIIFLQ